MLCKFLELYKLKLFALGLLVELRLRHLRLNLGIPELVLPR